MSGEVIRLGAPRSVRFPLYRMVGPNERVQWLPMAEAAILYGDDNVAIGGKVGDSTESPPRPITTEEIRFLTNISDDWGRE